MVVICAGLLNRMSKISSAVRMVSGVASARRSRVCLRGYSHPIGRGRENA